MFKLVIFILECLSVQVEIGPITTIVFLVGQSYFVTSSKNAVENQDPNLGFKSNFSCLPIDFET